MYMQSMSLEVKLNIIRCIEVGERQLDVCTTLDSHDQQHSLFWKLKTKSRNMVSPSTLFSWNQSRALSEGCLYPVLWFF
jgi:hypothetical protein